jgi:hypothetical protein
LEQVEQTLQAELHALVVLIPTLLEQAYHSHRQKAVAVAVHLQRLAMVLLVVLVVQALLLEAAQLELLDKATLVETATNLVHVLQAVVVVVLPQQVGLTLRQVEKVELVLALIRLGVAQLHQDKT